MKKVINSWKVFGGFMLIAIGLVGCTGLGFETIKQGKMAPDFELATLAGEQIDMSKIRGRPAVLGFMTTWCPPCQEELLTLKRLHEQYPELVVLVVATGFGRGKEDNSIWRAYADKHGLDFNIALDGDARVYDGYQVIGIPALFFIDRAGVIQARYLGSNTTAKIDHALNAIGIKP